MDLELIYEVRRMMFFEMPDMTQSRALKLVALYKALKQAVKH